MAVVSLNHLVKQMVKSIVRIMASSVYTDSRVNVLTSGQNHPLKWNTCNIFFKFINVKYLWSKKSTQQRFRPRWKLRKTNNIFRSCQMRTCNGDITQNLLLSCTIHQSFLRTYHCLYTIVHILHQVYFCSSQSSSV